jgi:hypothetical protein
MPILLIPRSSGGAPAADGGVRSMIAFWMGGAALVPAAGQQVARSPIKPNLRGNIGNNIRGNFQ